jgi:malate dehydrogenase
LAGRGLADIVVVDILEGIPTGKALDILQACPVEGVDVQITGGNDYAPTADSDIVVFTAGFPRKPGMSRDDLLWANYDIVKATVEQAVKYSPNAILMVVTNPLDAMCHVAYRVSGFPKHRVMGMAGILDTARFRTFVAQALNVSVSDIVAFVLGGHGDTMVPLVRYSSVAGIPLTDLLDAATLQQIVKRTRDGGAEIRASGGALQVRLPNNRLGDFSQPGPGKAAPQLAVGAGRQVGASPDLHVGKVFGRLECLDESGDLKDVFIIG